MSGDPTLALFVALALIVPAKGARPPLTPPAGSAGAANSAISGLPFGPANPRSLSDPSGIGVTPRVPRRCAPTPRTVTSTVQSTRRRRVHRSRLSPYTGASQRITSARAKVTRENRRFGVGREPEVRSFCPGICRGC